jgi:hypothetical protein
MAEQTPMPTMPQDGDAEDFIYSSCDAPEVSRR